MAKTPDVAELLEGIKDFMPTIVSGANAIQKAKDEGKKLSKDEKNAIRLATKFRTQYEFKEQRRKGQTTRWQNFKQDKFGDGTKSLSRNLVGAAAKGAISKIPFGDTFLKSREKAKLQREKYEQEQYKKFAKAKETQAEKDRKLQEQRDKETAAEQKAEALRQKLMEERARERAAIQQERDNKRAGKSAGGIALPNANGSFGRLSLPGPAGSNNSSLGGKSSGGIVEVNDDALADELIDVNTALTSANTLYDDIRKEIISTNRKVDKLLGAFIDEGEATRDQSDAQFNDTEREEKHTKALARTSATEQSSYLAKIASDMSSLKDCFGNQCNARSGGGSGGGGDAGGPGIFDRLADLFTGGVAGGAAGGVAGGAGKKMFDLLKRGVKGGIKGVKAGGPAAAGAALITEIVQQVDSTKDAKIDSDTGRMKGAESGIIGDVIKGITGVEVPNVFQGTFNAGLDFNDWWKGEGSFKDKKKLEELQGRIKLLSNGAKDENSSPEEVAAMSEQIENLKALQQASIDALKNKGVDGLQKFTTELIPEALKITEDLAIKLKERDIAEHKRKSEIVTSEEDIVKVYDDLIANMQATMGGKTDKSKELAIKSLLEQKQKALSTWSSNTLGIDSGAKPEPKPEVAAKPVNVGAVTQAPDAEEDIDYVIERRRDELDRRRNSSTGLQIGNEPVMPGQPFSNRQMSAISTGISMSPANSGGYSQAILEQYEKQKSETVPLAGTRDDEGPIKPKEYYWIGKNANEIAVDDKRTKFDFLKPGSVYQAGFKGDVFDLDKKPDAPRKIEEKAISKKFSAFGPNGASSNLGLSNSASASLAGLSPDDKSLADSLEKYAEITKESADTFKGTVENNKSIWEKFTGDLASIGDTIKAASEGTGKVMDLMNKGVEMAFDAAMELGDKTSKEYTEAKERIAKDPDGKIKGIQRYLTGDRTDLSPEERIKLINDTEASRRGLTTKSMTDKEKSDWAAKFSAVPSSSDMDNMVAPPQSLTDYVNSIDTSTGSIPQLSPNPADPTSPALTTATESSSTSSTSSTGTLSGVEANPEYKQIVENRIAQKIAGGMTKEDARDEARLEVKDEIVKGKIKLKSTPQTGSSPGSPTKPNLVNIGSTPIGARPSVPASGPTAMMGGGGGGGDSGMVPSGMIPAIGGESSTAPTVGEMVPADVGGTPSLDAATPSPATSTQTTSGPMSKDELKSGMLNELKNAGITDTQGQANIMASLDAESGFRPRSEEIEKYSGKTLFKLYGPGSGNKVRFNSIEEANAVVAQGPEAVGNKIYGGRMGNAADEGYKYRGRGLIQLTGKDNYKSMAKKIGRPDLVDNPDLANDPVIAQKIAAQYAKDRIKNPNDMASVNKGIGHAGGGAENAKRAKLAADYKQRIGSGELAAKASSQSAPGAQMPATIGSAPVNARPSKEAKGGTTLMGGGGGGGGGGGMMPGGIPGMGGSMPSSGIPGISTGGVAGNNPGMAGVGGTPSIGGGTPGPTTSTGMPNITGAPSKMANVIDTDASRVQNSVGIDKAHYDTFRGTVAQIESGGKYNIKGGSSGKFDGAYQMGQAAQQDAAKALGIAMPTREEFRANPQLQEKMFDAYTAKNNAYLMKNEKYAAMSPEKKMEVLGYAHNQGAGGASKYLRTGKAQSDAFGTVATKYSKAISGNYAALDKQGGGAQPQPGTSTPPGIPTTAGAPPTQGGQMQPMPGATSGAPTGPVGGAALGGTAQVGYQPTAEDKKYFTNTDKLRGMDPGTVEKMRNASIETGKVIPLTSGFRSQSHQDNLRAAAVQKYGSEKAASKWVAKTSMHTAGVATDIGGADKSANSYWAKNKDVAASLEKQGMYRPMGHEAWHWEDKSKTEGKDRGGLAGKLIQDRNNWQVGGGKPGEQTPQGQLQPPPGQQPGGALAGAPAAPQSQADMLAAQTEGMGDSQADQLAAQTAEFGAETAPGSGQLSPAPGAGTGGAVAAAGDASGGGGGGGMTVPDGTGGGGFGSNNPGIGSLGGTNGGGGTASASSPTETANTENSVKRINDAMMIYGMA